jgi:hypothetical protein
MNSNGTHIFTLAALDWISRNYERLKIEKFKEPKDIINSMKEEPEYETTALGDANELKLTPLQLSIIMNNIEKTLDSIKKLSLL